ncbi:MAG: replication factor C small subunit [Candidatus Thermoplasmatota archaeon]|jgi:replication factor C small subunit|nr:replication factor C small subunit [Candidatus Thermoplasmatota archaeon]MCL5732881.1 replication factor C small subunit [Candidatus Thermoplasmatota archaeon]WMT43703.1 MAG: replication factor C small subunit [Cuniculiplasma divulgatum]
MIDIWTEKYRPRKLSDIVGQDEIIRKLQSFVRHRELPHLIFAGPAGVGKTTAALSVAIELFGEDWRDNFLELNASNERGIDVIRDNVKDFARIMPSNGLGFKIIFLDEADQLTPEAQAALRRTMELYSSATRFIFSCNYSSQIIPPIQSRTVVMRFRPIRPEDMKKRIEVIAKQENFTIDDDAMAAITEISEGDMRKALNILQTIKSSGEMTASRIYEISGMANPKQYKSLLSKALSGLFDDARETLDSMMIEQGLSGIDIVRGIHSVVRKELISPRQKLQIIMALGESEFRIVEGSSDTIQLDALMARLAYIGQEFN